MEAYRLIAYDLQTGARLCRLSARKASWSHSWNEAGSMSAEILIDRDMAMLDLASLIMEQRTALALWRGDRIVHAGPVTTAPEWDPKENTLTVSCGGGMTCLEWLPAMDSLLRSRMFDGTVVIDEDNPDPGLNVGFGGSGGDIIKAWVGLAQQWASGRLPIDVPSGYEAEHHDLTVTAAAWDFRTCADMVDATLQLGHGGQARFDATTDLDGRLRWTTVWSETGIVDREHRWNTGLPGQRVLFTGLAAGESPAVTDSWASGGKNSDRLLLTRQQDADALRAGWPIIFKGDTSNGSADSLAALHATARNNLAASRRDRTWKLSVGTEHDPHVGDHVRLRVNDPYLHERRSDGTAEATTVGLIVTDVSGGTDSEWLDVQCRQYTDSIDGIRAGSGDPMALVARRMRALGRGAKLANAAAGSSVYGTTGKVRQERNS